jgi:hypothetical protein
MAFGAPQNGWSRHPIIVADPGHPLKDWQWVAGSAGPKPVKRLAKKFWPDTSYPSDTGCDGMTLNST